MRQILVVAGDGEIGVDFVVVGLDVGVRDGPVFTIPVVRLALEIVIRQPQRETPPDVGLATQQPRAHPGVARAGGRMILLVYQGVLDVTRSTPSPDIRDDVLEGRAFGGGGPPAGE